MKSRLTMVMSFIAVMLLCQVSFAAIYTGGSYDGYDSGESSEGTIGDTPTMVELSSFSAKGLDSYVLLEWETASEIDNAGFHLWRNETGDGEYTRLTDYLIPAQGGATWGAAYSYEDYDVEPGQTYYYKLEDIDYAGISGFHGPVSATLGNEAIVLIFPEDGALVPVYPPATFEWESAGLVRFKMGFSRSSDFTSKVIVLPASSESIGGWITGESYTPTWREWRRIWPLGRGARPFTGRCTEKMKQEKVLFLRS